MLQGQLSHDNIFVSFVDQIIKSIFFLSPPNNWQKSFATFGLGSSRLNNFGNRLKYKFWFYPDLFSPLYYIQSFEELESASIGIQFYIVKIMKLTKIMKKPN